MSGLDTRRASTARLGNVLCGGNGRRASNYGFRRLPSRRRRNRLSTAGEPFREADLIRSSGDNKIARNVRFARMFHRSANG